MSHRIPDRIGDYRVLRAMGRGGMGVLYHAVHVDRHRHVALEIMSPDAVVDEGARARYHHED